MSPFVPMEDVPLRGGGHPHGALAKATLPFLAAVLACLVPMAAVPALLSWLPKITIG